MKEEKNVSQAENTENDCFAFKSDLIRIEEKKKFFLFLLLLIRYIFCSKCIRFDSFFNLLFFFLNRKDEKKFIFKFVFLNSHSFTHYI